MWFSARLQNITYTKKRKRTGRNVFSNLSGICKVVTKKDFSIDTYISLFAMRFVLH